MAPHKQISNERKIEGPESMKSLTYKDESPLKNEEKTPGTAKPAVQAEGSAKGALQKTPKTKAVSKISPIEKKSNISIDEVEKPVIALNTESASTDETTGQVQQAKSTRRKSTSKQSQSPMRYGVESGEIIADQLIRANCEVCLFWLDAATQFSKTYLEKMVPVEGAGQMADEMARGLLEAGTDYAYNAVRQVAEIANTGISNFEGMQGENISVFDFGKRTAI